ncbi:hypothetical protein MGSAQ_002270 [marine sediment metagenome]|uniref:Uncharacterized protein n=1 Tax=marine sediment metagenome TaxID=412755 RepID=A0A1B6NRY9_9ZZZZ
MPRHHWQSTGTWGAMTIRLSRVSCPSCKGEKSWLMVNP